MDSDYGLRIVSQWAEQFVHKMKNITDHYPLMPGNVFASFVSVQTKHMLHFKGIMEAANHSPFTKWKRIFLFRLGLFAECEMKGSYFILSKMKMYSFFVWFFSHIPLLHFNELHWKMETMKSQTCFDIPKVILIKNLFVTIQRKIHVISLHPHPDLKWIFNRYASLRTVFYERVHTSQNTHTHTDMLIKVQKLN